MVARAEARSVCLNVFAKDKVKEIRLNIEIISFLA